jgi:hypothetical protein
VVGRLHVVSQAAAEIVSETVAVRVAAGIGLLGVGLI